MPGPLEVKGEFVVAVPARNVLLVTGADDADGLKRVRDRAAEIMRTGDHTLTDTLFVRRDGGWAIFTP